jgi:hypothetical protein
MAGTNYYTVKETELTLVDRTGKEFKFEKCNNVMNGGSDLYLHR